MKKQLMAFGLIGGLAYIVFWWGFVVFLPFGRVLENYAELILAPAWIPLNMLQIVGVVCLMMFFHLYSRDHYPRTGPALAFTMLQMLGFACFCGVAFYEAVLWPVFAVAQPAILNVVTGPVYTSSLFLGSTVVGILAFMAGNIYLGLRAMRLHSRVWGIVLIAGAVLLCLGYLSGPLRYIVQSTGITLFGAAFIGLPFSKKIT